jgi:hypothetical protein
MGMMIHPPWPVMGQFFPWRTIGGRGCFPPVPKTLVESHSASPRARSSTAWHNPFARIHQFRSSHSRGPDLQPLGTTRSRHSSLKKVEPLIPAKPFLGAVGFFLLPQNTRGISMCVTQGQIFKRLTQPLRQKPLV